jgi:hypothetical protein
MAMLRPSGEAELRNKRRNGIGHSNCHFLKDRFASERPGSAAARPEFGFISLKG